MINASTAICAAKRHPAVSNATTTGVIPTFTSNQRPLRRKRSAKKRWKVARSKRLATTAQSYSRLCARSFRKMAPRKREGCAQKEKRGPSVSEAGSVIETHEHKGDLLSLQAQAE